MSRSISLSQGKSAIVDDDDYDRLVAYSWWFARKRYDDRGYALTTLSRELGRPNVRMHHMVLGVSPPTRVDHIDGDGLNNQRGNLRVCTNQQNQRHMRKQRSVTSSQFKGVSWHKGGQKWEAGIRGDGKRLTLGLFASEEDAARAYNSAARELFGEFAWLNPVEGECPPNRKYGKKLPLGEKA